MTPIFHRLAFASLVAGLVTLLAGAAWADILVRVDGVRGDSTLQGYEGWFRVKSFTFSFDRSEGTGFAKAGTKDLLIGPLSMEGIEITKSLDSASSALLQTAMNGSRIAGADVAFVARGRDARPNEILRYTLDGVWVSSWSTSADEDDVPEETIVFEFARIAFVQGRNRASWDRTANKPWSLQQR